MANTQTYGITATGFVVKQQSQIISEINAIIQSIWGPNVNLGPESNFGQFSGIFAEREALIWQLLEAVYNSQYPSGAEGTSVDNILALTNLRRLPATATITDSTPDVQTAFNVNGITLYGLLLWGVPGTLIPQNSTVQTSASPPLSFLNQGQYTIGSIVNAAQVLFLSNAPNTGAFTLSFYDPAEVTCTTESIPYNALAAVSQLHLSTTPSSASHFGLTLEIAGTTLTTANITTNAAYPTAAAIQSAIQALSGYSAVTVSGSAGTYSITWGSIANPLLGFANNTTGATITTIDSIQAAVNNLHDATNLYYPFTDLIATGSISSTSVTFTYGGGTVAATASGQTSANPSCASQQQAIFSVATNTLFQSSTATNLQVTQTIQGSGVWGTGSNLSPTQGIGTAYGTVPGVALCTATGPNFVNDGAISIIGSGTTGWQGVLNQLTCVTGSDLEDDTDALARRATLLAANASTTLAAIIDAVTTLVELDGGTVIGFENTSQAALQVLTFGSVPMTGSFEITVGSEVTGAISVFTAAAIQTAIQALSGYSTALVTGGQTGVNPPIFTIDFNGSQGGQAQSLVTVPGGSNSTGVTITPSFGRPGSSFEIVVGNQGAISNTQIAQTILTEKAAGIKAYGNTVTTVFDEYNNAYQIGFSTPTEINFYVIVSMVTDYYNTPGSSGSGINPIAQFTPGAIATILQDILTIGNSFGIGATGTAGQVIGFGSSGLIGAFNSVPGIISYTMYFGTAPNPSTNTNVTLLQEQQAVFTALNTSISWS